jgi:hypothetical protein
MLELARVPWARALRRGRIVRVDVVGDLDRLMSAGDPNAADAILTSQIVPSWLPIEKTAIVVCRA